MDDCIKKNSHFSRLLLTDLWWIPAVFSLVIVLAELCVGVWSWGLMDDHGLRTLSGNIFERFTAHLKGQWAWGRFQYIYSAYVACLYRAFDNSPQYFYIFRWAVVMTSLIPWCLLVVKLTGKRFAAPIFLTVTLAFSSFYYQFFFLSTQEIFGLLFTALSALYLLSVVESGSVDSKSFLNIKSFIFCIIFLLLAFGSKEPFVSVGIAFGLSLIGLFVFNRHKAILYAGLMLLGLTVCYALFLKSALPDDFSGQMNFLNGPKILANLQHWFSIVVYEHVIWLCIVGLVYFTGRFEKISPKHKWGIGLSVLCYFGYLCISLPWQVSGYYLAPLGVFFALFITLIITQRVESLKPTILIPVLLLSLGMTVYVSQKNTRFHAQYQYDTANLAQWLAENVLFQSDIKRGAVVRGNAAEPCATVPEQVRFLYGKDLPTFHFTSHVKDIIKDPKTRYYLWKTDGGNQDLRRLGNMFSPVFISKYWVMFRRMY